MSAPQSASSNDIFLGRQPILDGSEAVVGYELLFRDSQEDKADVSSPVQATADVVCHLFAELGLAGALGGRKAFINCDDSFLKDDSVELLLTRNVVLELDVRMIEAPGVIERCKDLSGRGVEFSVSGVSDLTDGLKRMAGTASFVKVDARHCGPAFTPVASRLKSVAPSLLACKVESEAAMDCCRQAGFSHFQGYYFAKPMLIGGRKLDPSTLGLLKIIGLLQRDADVAELELAFKHEPALVINLLCLTNSVGIGLLSKVGSIRQAISVLGRRQLQRWLQLLLFSYGRHRAPLKHNPLMQLAALRAALMEVLARRCFPEKLELPEAAFLCGLMSLVPVALGMPMIDVLSSIVLAPEVRRALSQHDGELGTLLELVEVYDANDMEATHRVMCRLGGRVDFHALAQYLSEAIAWVQALGEESPAVD
jgi:c-di-GMP-related signal transduction protein